MPVPMVMEAVDAIRTAVHNAVKDLPRAAYREVLGEILDDTRGSIEAFEEEEADREESTG